MLSVRSPSLTVDLLHFSSLSKHKQSLPLLEILISMELQFQAAKMSHMEGNTETRASPYKDKVPNLVACSVSSVFSRMLTFSTSQGINSSHIH